MKILTSAKAIPPKDGIAIGIMISAPRPVDVNTGNNAIMVVETVIKAGRILRNPASTTASRTSFKLVGRLRPKL